MKKRDWMILVAEGIVWCLLFLFVAKTWNEERMQREISEQILRFHVLANSDSKEDQEEKMRVKHAVSEYLKPILEDAQSKEETMDCIKQELYNIEEIAQNMLGERVVTVSLERDWFPAITYGDCTFPSGTYDTLRVQIGEAKGHNWWCVLYPGLCFSSAIKPVATEEDKNLLKHVLSEESYHFLFRREKTKIRFRLFGLELFGENR